MRPGPQTLNPPLPPGLRICCSTCPLFLDPFCMCYQTLKAQDKLGFHIHLGSGSFALPHPPHEPWSLLLSFISSLI